MATPDGGAAFPSRPIETWDETGKPHLVPAHPGMSLRDYFAAKALNAMLSQPADAANFLVYDDVKNAAKWAYEFADAMLAEREREK